jgi:hypothetical protein
MDVGEPLMNRPQVFRGVLEEWQKVRICFNPADHDLFHHNLPTAYTTSNAISRTVLPGGLPVPAAAIQPRKWVPLKVKKPIPVALSRRHSNLARDRSQR